MSTEPQVEATEVIEKLLDQIRVMSLQLAIATAKIDRLVADGQQTDTQ